MGENECRASREFLNGRDEMKDFSAQFRALVEGALPKDSRVLIPRGDVGLMVLATWRLPRDAFRPAKRSRMIRIAISQEALEDYALASDGFRLASNQRFIAWLERQLATFDPTHDAPLGVEPPPVTWALETRELNGTAP
jgi:hypothetical protein